MMKSLLNVLISFLAVLAAVTLSGKAEEAPDVFHAQGRSTLVNEGWEFSLNEGEYETVNLPHDWSIKEAFSTDCEAESGFLPGGTGVYRKSFVFPKEYDGKCIVMEFGGVYMNAEVYANGRRLGMHPYGYTDFAFDLSRDLVCDGKTENVIEVQVDNALPSSRWYSGSGIYRDVRLIVTDPVHIARNGIRIQTPEINPDGESSTNVELTVSSPGDAERTIFLHTAILDEEGTAVAEGEAKLNLNGNGTQTQTVNLSVSNVRLWTLKQPYRYTCLSELREENGTVLDSVSTRFGYRTMTFDSDRGFFLNGEPVKLKGVCLHHDQGALGAAASPRAIERQLDLLQEMGINAIRTAHNPADTHLLEECSRRGILVIEEAFDTWLIPKNGNDNDYSRWFLEAIGEDNEILDGEAGLYWSAFDARAMVLHSRNEPCVMMYSIGNEILGNIEGDTSEYPRYAEMLAEWISRYDERPVTIADNMTIKPNPTQEGIDTAVHEAGGIVGLNYATGESMDRYHREHPDWKLYGSETTSVYGSRGEYAAKGIDRSRHQVTAYDEETVDWGMTARETWLNTISRDYMAGQFVWTGFDYIGEPEPWNGISPGSVTDGSPSPHSSYFGILDTAGLPKDAYYFYQSQWREDLTVLHVLPDWNRANIRRDFLGRVKVMVYTNAPAVELFQNGTSLGRIEAKTVTTEGGYSYRLYDGELAPSWKVSWKTGGLRAVAYDENGNEIKQFSGRASVGPDEPASRLILAADRSAITCDGKDLVYLTVSLKDVHGNLISSEDRPITFHLEGEGVILGSDNGDPTDLQGYQDNTDTDCVRRTFHGQTVLIVQSTKKAGRIRITAEAEGVPTASAVVETEEKPEPVNAFRRTAEAIRKRRESYE